MTTTTTTPKRRRKGELGTEKEMARLYYMQGESQKQIAERIGTSQQTITRWVKDGQWDTIRASHTVSRHELVNKMLASINQRLDHEDWSPDELAKAASAIEKLDKQTNIVTIIEVFSAYNRWLVSRMQIDPELTPEMVKVMNKYQDIFINENLSGVSISFNQ